MNETAQLAGFVAAHAILCVSRGASLTTPLLVIEKEDGNQQFIQVTGKTSQEAVSKGEQLLKKPTAGARRGVLAFEAYLNLPPSQTDAIFLHARFFQPDTRPLLIAVPFRAANHPDGFAVYRPKFIVNEEEAIKLGALDSFLRGTAMHPTGHAVWQAHLDESR